jgi:uncharacterized surface protein with fasciclin (FAS1) repeats
MKNLVLLVIALFAAVSFTNAQCTGSSKASAKKASYEKDVVDIALASEVHTTLVAALKAADLVNALKADGPFTIFAPTNDAFAKLPEGTVETLLKPENKDQLTSVLTYHVVAGNIDAAAVVGAIEAGNGKATLTTLNGETIEASIKNDKVFLKDAKGRMAIVTTTDLKGSNGVIHVIDEVILP